MVENKTVLTIVGGIGFLILLVIITLFIVSIFTDVYDGFSFETSSSSETLLTNGGVTLLQTPNSISATRLNQTWLDFDGVDDRGTMQYINLSEVTFTLWFKRNNLTATQDLFSLMNGLIRTTDSQILYWTNTAVGNKVLNYTPDTDWNFIAVTHERTNCRIYYNNISVAEFTNCRTIDTRDVTKTFGSYGPYNYLNGSMDDIRVFNRSLDSEAVMDIYYKGREASKLGSGVPILGYHRVDNIGTTYYTNLTDFADQMEWLNSSGYTTITFKHFVNYTLGLYELPDNPVILSFDDGNRNVYTNATPIMDLYDFVGCANIPTGSVGTAGKMNWTDLQNLSDKGWEIVSHSVTHSNFLTLSSAERIAEFNDSKNAIDGNISGYNTTSFIYPYTTFNETTNAEASVYYTFTGGLDNYIQNVRYWNYGYKYTNLYGGFERLAMANVTTFENFVKAVTQDNQLKIQYNFNENQGTDVHDVSGNGNNGTITGASWNNDGITVALTNLIDYTLVGSTFNLLTNLWDQVVVSYVYGDSHTVEAMNSNFTAGIDNVSEKIPTILLISAVILLFGVLIILIAKSKEMGIGDGASL